MDRAPLGNVTITTKSKSITHADPDRCRSNEMIRRYERKFSENQELNKNNTMTHPTKYKQ